MDHEADMVDDRDAGVPFGQVANFEHKSVRHQPSAFLNEVYYIVLDVKRLVIGLVLAKQRYRKVGPIVSEWRRVTRKPHNFLSAKDSGSDRNTVIESGEPFHAGKS